ncbi:MAG: DUF1491 family protein [Cypionkella sp.]|nr:DUF1491 family protein [Cypionkella sp.]
MSSARLTAGLWVSAYLNRLRLAGIACYVMAKGDATAGAVVVKLASLDGQARLFERRFDLEQDRRIWAVLAEGGEGEMDAILTRARARDRDLWVIEIEDRAGRHLLGEEGLD